MSGHVFLSYSPTDQTYVTQLAARITEARIPVWYDRGPGTWSDRTQHAIDASSVVVPVVTPASAASEAVRQELWWARQRGRPIRPVQLAPVDPGALPPELLGLPYEEVTGGRLPGPAYLQELRQLFDATPAAPPVPAPPPRGRAGGGVTRRRMMLAGGAAAAGAIAVGGASYGAYRVLASLTEGAPPIEPSPPLEPSPTRPPVNVATLAGPIRASGATFPIAFYRKAIDVLAPLAPNLRPTYTGLGSGAARQDFAAGATDLAGTDTPVLPGDGIPAGSFLYVPTVAAPLRIIYNLTELDRLRLGPSTLAGILQRRITTWDDPAVIADNTGRLPDVPITVVHRTDSSGVTGALTGYLAAAAPGWTLGSGTTVAWPAGTQGAQDSVRLIQAVAQTPGAIGYLDVGAETTLPAAAIRNRDGRYVAPTAAGATATTSYATIPDDLAYSPVDAPGAATYPLTMATFLLARTSYADATRARAVKGFLEWLLTDGQALAGGLGFGRLGPALQARALAQLDRIAR